MACSKGGVRQPVAVSKGRTVPICHMGHTSAMTPGKDASVLAFPREETAALSAAAVLRPAQRGHLFSGRAATNRNAARSTRRRLPTARAKGLPCRQLSYDFAVIVLGHAATGMTAKVIMRALSH